MKQYIIISQLNELTDKQKEKLREWWKPQYGDKYAWHDGYVIEDEFNWNDGYLESNQEYFVMTEEGKALYPLLSIGRMIEFLEDHEDFEDTTLGITENWYEKIFFSSPTKVSGNFRVRKGLSGELCDNLWELVKEVLNEKD